MGMFDSDNFEFDTENLRTQANKIAEIANNLESAQKDLGAGLTQLREDWQTGAGDKFFEKYDSDWVKILDNHIKLLRDLVDALKYAADNYEPVAEEYAKLTLG